jgi:hypothetical protein
VTLNRTTFGITTLCITMNSPYDEWYYAECHIFFYCAECDCAEVRYAECRYACVVMMSVVMLSVVMLSVVMLSVIMLRVVTPLNKRS